jgi:hypothetical protein
MLFVCIALHRPQSADRYRPQAMPATGSAWGPSGDHDTSDDKHSGRPWTLGKWLEFLSSQVSGGAMSGSQVIAGHKPARVQQ